jgi:hypothetical protein
MITVQEREVRVREDLVRVSRARVSHDVLLVLVGNAALLALAVIMFRDDVPGIRLDVWAACIFAATVTRVAWHYRAAQVRVTDRTFLRGVRVVALLYGLSWGVGLALLMPWLVTAELAIVLAGLAGICGSAVSTLSADSPSFRCFITGMLGPLPVGLLAASTDQAHIVTAILVVVFAIAMILIHHQVHSDLTEHLRTVIQLRESEALQTRLISELRAAISNVKTLTGLLPICASCKKVRDDMGYWGSVERYISDHTDARFSHGVCPDCFPKLFPGIPLPEPEAAHV